MITTRIKHLKIERETWLRTLDFIQQENVFLKNCLSDIIMNDINPEVLENAEYFQSQFINKDTVVSLLRYDIAEQNRLLENWRTLNGHLEGVVKKQDGLRVDMEKMEKEFSLLKFHFNNYMAGVL